MALKEGVRNIQLSDEVVLALLKKGLNKGFKTFKAYAEHILKEHALVSELKEKQK